MGVEYKAKLIVGLPFNEIKDFLGEEGHDPFDLGLEYASPYFDADCGDCVFGVIVAETGDYSWDYVNVSDHKKASDKFTEITGLVGKLILAPHGH